MTGELVLPFSLSFQGKPGTFPKHYNRVWLALQMPLYRRASTPLLRNALNVKR